MIMFVFCNPWGPNGILRFRDKLFSRGWAKSVLSHKCFKKRNTKCDTKTATLFYHATAAGSCSMGWRSCLVCPSTHTSLRSNIYVLTFSLALVTSHACMHAAMKAALLSAVSEHSILPAYRVHGYWDADLCLQAAGYYGDDTVETRRLATWPGCWSEPLGHRARTPACSRRAHTRATSKSAPCGPPRHRRAYFSAQGGQACVPVPLNDFRSNHSFYNAPGII